MKRSRYKEEQIVEILRQAEAGVCVVDLCRQNGISDATFYKWRSKFGGINISDAKRLRQLSNCTRDLFHFLNSFSRNGSEEDGKVLSKFDFGMN